LVGSVASPEAALAKQAASSSLFRTLQQINQNVWSPQINLVHYLGLALADFGEEGRDHADRWKMKAWK